MKNFTLYEGLASDLHPKKFLAKPIEWKPEDLAASFYIPMSERLKDAAFRIFIEKLPAQAPLNDIQATMYAFYAAMLKKTCRFFYEKEGQDFEKFLEALVNALLLAKWQGESFGRFTGNLACELASMERAGLLKHRAERREKKEKRGRKKAKE